jgi:ABC-type lipoprotein release transport system permease subunit
LKLVVIGTVVLLVAMALNYFGLAEFKNRIVDSNSLLRIIPKDIAAKHES